MDGVEATRTSIRRAVVMRELQPYFDRLLLVPGREITTFQGHAKPSKWRVVRGMWLEA